MWFPLRAQKNVFDGTGKKSAYVKEDVDLIFAPSAVLIPKSEGPELAPLISLAPTLVDIGFKIANNFLEKRQKEYSGEYNLERSYLEAGVAGPEGKVTVPNFTFQRMVQLEDKSGETLAFQLALKAEKLEGLDAFYYYVDTITLIYAKARTGRKDNTLDYTIELKPVFIINGEKKVLELSPIYLPSMAFGTHSMKKSKYRTTIIPLPKNAYFSDLALKIVETNPAKVNVEKVLELFNSYKDEAKTIINNFLPAADSSSTGNTGVVGDPNTPDSND